MKVGNIDVKLNVQISREWFQNENGIKVNHRKTLTMQYVVVICEKDVGMGPCMFNFVCILSSLPFFSIAIPTPLFACFLALPSLHLCTFF